MDIRKFILRQCGILAIGQLICVGAMIAVFALMGKFSSGVVIGGVVGAVIAVANFFFMAVSANAAADRAENQDVKGGKASMKASFALRLLLIFIVMVAFAKSGVVHTVAMVLPVVFTRPIFTVAEFFRKSGEKT